MVSANSAIWGFRPNRVSPGLSALKNFLVSSSSLNSGKGRQYAMTVRIGADQQGFEKKPAISHFHQHTLRQPRGQQSEIDAAASVNAIIIEQIFQEYFAAAGEATYPSVLRMPP